MVCQFSESDRKNETDGFDQVGTNPCNSKSAIMLIFQFKVMEITFCNIHLPNLVKSRLFLLKLQCVCQNEPFKCISVAKEK